MTDLSLTDITLPPVYKLAAFDSLDSTNDELAKMARKGAPEFTVVWALSQTKGRGRRGRTWVSQSGNLFTSLLLRPGLPLQEAAKSSFVASLGVADALEEILGEKHLIQCKWPNDVLVNGAKISGILLECQGQKQAPAQTDWIVVGIGVNVLSHPEQTPYPATCLQNLMVQPPYQKEMLEILCRHFQIWAERWINEGFETVHRAWMAKAKGLGQDISVHLPDRTLHGIFEKLDLDGSLILRTTDETHRIQAGDVYFEI